MTAGRAAAAAGALALALWMGAPARAQEPLKLGVLNDFRGIGSVAVVEALGDMVKGEVKRPYTTSSLQVASDAPALEGTAWIAPVAATQHPDGIA